MMSCHCLEPFPSPMCHNVVIYQYSFAIKLRCKGVVKVLSPAAFVAFTSGITTVYSSNRPWLVPRGLFEESPMAQTKSESLRIRMYHPHPKCCFFFPSIFTTMSMVRSENITISSLSVSSLRMFKVYMHLEGFSSLFQFQLFPSAEIIASYRICFLFCR